MTHSDRPDPRKRRYREEAALGELLELSEPLYRQLDELRAERRYDHGRPPHLCCTRRYNQMRISPLEARAIAEAFRRDEELARKLPAVLDRLRKELVGLKDNDERQSFDCPLLDGKRCLVHGVAKPLGCLAWHPIAADEDVEAAFTGRGYQALAGRDRLNDRIFGPSWKLRVIPLWLRRVFEKELARRERAPRKRRPPSSSRGGGGRPSRG